MFSVAQTSLIMLGVITLVDTVILFSRNVGITCVRKTPKRMSLGDENTIDIEIESSYRLALHCNLIDEIPVQFQKRDFAIRFSLKSGEEKILTYQLKPLARGEYLFHNINLFIKSHIGLSRKAFTV